MNEPYRCMLVSPRQFGYLSFGEEGMSQIEDARKRLGERDLFPAIPVLTLNMLRCEMGWPAAVLKKPRRPRSRPLFAEGLQC